ncbi:hypothetical protein ACFWQL_22230 [Amycolatopsis thermoflava]|uniref:hypothetical protein n=1 Tax=Amycolatopsis thermoflava TaxID=84480 RepID=UPI00364FD54B
MRDAGVPAEVHVLILDGLENLTLGAALTQAVKPADIRNRISPHVDAEEEPALASAVKANEWRTGEKLFAESIRSFRGAVQR